MFNLYKGVRAGGGIGDELEPPDGDDSEVYRIIFDISFFFFIIVILLAILQGMYITIDIWIISYSFEFNLESEAIYINSVKCDNLLIGVLKKGKHSWSVILSKNSI